VQETPIISVSGPPGIGSVVHRVPSQWAAMPTSLPFPELPTATQVWFEEHETAFRCARSGGVD